MSCKDPGLIHSIDPCQVRNHCHGGEFGKRLDPVKDASSAQTLIDNSGILAFISGPPADPPKQFRTRQRTSCKQKSEIRGQHAPAIRLGASPLRWRHHQRAQSRSVRRLDSRALLEQGKPISFRAFLTLTPNRPLTVANPKFAVGRFCDIANGITDAPLLIGSGHRTG